MADDCWSEIGLIFGKPPVLPPVGELRRSPSLPAAGSSASNASNASNAKSSAPSVQRVNRHAKGTPFAWVSFERFSLRKWRRHCARGRAAHGCHPCGGKL
jgi:hypothetical protein